MKKAEKACISNREWQDWGEAVLRQVRFRPDHAAIWRELMAHLEDCAADFERIGYTREEAEARALEAMGSAEEVGKQMDRAHTTHWNWLWQFSRSLLAACLIWIAAMAVVNPDTVGYAWNRVEELTQGAWFYQGLSPYLDPEGTGHPGGVTEETADKAFLGYGTLPEAVELGAYRITAETACWWRDSGGDDWLCVAFTTKDARFPWTAPAPMFWDDCTVEGSRDITVSSIAGRELLGSYVHWLTIELEGTADEVEVRYDRADWPLVLRVGKEAAS